MRDLIETSIRLESYRRVAFYLIKSVRLELINLFLVMCNVNVYFSNDKASAYYIIFNLNKVLLYCFHSINFRMYNVLFYIINLS
jgi:hypothetical protein